jgi:hypothetical protein
MTRGRLGKRERQAEQLRKKRAQAASVLATGAKVPPTAIQVAARRSRPSVGPAIAISEPLPPMRYPAKRAGAIDNVGVFEATTGTTCATSPIAVIGGATTVATAATGINLIANQGFVLSGGGPAVAATSVNNNDLCIATSAGVQLSGVLVWATQ